MQEIRKILFDTDIGGDSDDVTALDLLISAHKRGLCRLLGVSCTSLIPEGFACARAVLESHGMGDLPLSAKAPQKIIPGWYGAAAAKAFSRLSRMEEPVSLPLPMLRRLIADHPGVVLVVVGDCSNLAELLQSPPDDISPLSGAELVKNNVSFVSLMGGSFTHQNGIIADPPEYRPDGSINPCTEYNIACDIQAAKTVFETCPVPLYVLPYEAGFGVLSGKIFLHQSQDHPESFIFHHEDRFRNGRDSWDPMAAFFAVWGLSPCFEVSPCGRVMMDDQGITTHVPCSGGMHYVLQRALTKEETAQKIDDEIAFLFQ